MYVLYEDSGNFKAEKIFSQADTTMQVEAESGKRSKIKNNSVLFQFDAPAPATLLEQARALADTLDVAFLWECAPQAEFEAASLAEDYFGHVPNAIEKAATIFALNSAPAYFHRRGKGQYRPAPPEILTAALAAIEKKQKQAEQQQAWTDQLVAGELPTAIADVVGTLLTRPDKNTLQWKAFEAAYTQLGVSPEKLLLSVGAWAHPLALHQHRFMSVNFPKGIGFPSVQINEAGADLPLSDVIAYSVDDNNTTEIDDALSVTPLDNGLVQIGVHIAAPGLAVTRDSELDQIARSRMSTVYTPGHKITMLPDEVISAFSLNAGLVRPTLSLYVQANLDTGEIVSSDTRLEKIQVRENLRHSDLETSATEEALNDPGSSLTYGDWLKPLWRFANQLSRQRDEIRGKTENNNRVEYSFELQGSYTDPDTPVLLVPRRRNAPLDRLVAEYMILANNLWGGLMAAHGVPGIYRSQQAGRVRMSTHALPHESIGVPHYAWSTSPLRRYVDLVNQGQMLATAQHGVSARLVAPFKPKDADLFAIIGGFEAQYSIWNEHQSAMERYWCLRWLQQQQIHTLQASVIRDDLVRLEGVPLVIRVPGLPELERGHIVTLDIMGMDELSLELDCRLRDTAVSLE